MKKFEKLSKENLISELMLDTIKGGCCGGSNTPETYREGPHGEKITDTNSNPQMG